MGSLHANTARLSSLDPYACAYLVVQGGLPGQESCAGRGDEAVRCDRTEEGVVSRPGRVRARDLVGKGKKTTTHVLRGFARMVPSSRTMPTPILLAEPSMPRASIGGFFILLGCGEKDKPKPPSGRWKVTCRSVVDAS
jgi:hypothetical protein